jgi:hypothetical protein
MGGVAAPLLGILADADGLRSVFELLVVFPLAALLFSLALPVRRDPGVVATRRAPGVAAGPSRAPTAAPTANTTTTVASVTAAD